MGKMCAQYPEKKSLFYNFLYISVNLFPLFFFLQFLCTLSYHCAHQFLIFFFHSGFGDQELFSQLVLGLANILKLWYLSFLASEGVDDLGYCIILSLTDFSV